MPASCSQLERDPGEKGCLENGQLYSFDTSCIGLVLKICSSHHRCIMSSNIMNVGECTVSLLYLGCKATSSCPSPSSCSRTVRSRVNLVLHKTLQDQDQWFVLQNAEENRFAYVARIPVVLAGSVLSRGHLLSPVGLSISFMRRRTTFESPTHIINMSILSVIGPP